MQTKGLKLSSKNKRPIIFSDFTKQYSLNKTLRFELQPVPEVKPLPRETYYSMIIIGP